MPIAVKSQTFYRTSEACAIAGISRNTFFRWVRQGLFADVEHRDRRGWRLFTKEDLDRLEAESNIIQRSSLTGVSRKNVQIRSK
jgi:DNA-binding transcriptional MerR regulator